MEEKKFLGYVLVDPETNIPRYVGITVRNLRARFVGHLNDIYNRPTLNPHKTNWFKKLLAKGLMPIIRLEKECSNLEELKQFEIDYIKENKERYNLINLTPGGDWVAPAAHSRAAVLKRYHRAVVQYNVLGEKIAEFEVTEDIMREYNLRSKACSHITQCCKGTRTNAYGYLWKYKDDTSPLPIIDPKNTAFNKIVQYDLSGNRVGEYNTYADASRAIGDNSHGANIQSCCKGQQLTCKGFTFQLEPTFVYFDQNLYESKMIEFRNYVNQKFIKRQTIIQQFDLQGNFIANYNNKAEAAMVLGNRYYRQGITDCIKGRLESYLNFIWKEVNRPQNLSNSEDELIESIQS